jgi:hypothetical protein
LGEGLRAKTVTVDSRGEVIHQLQNGIGVEWLQDDGIRVERKCGTPIPSGRHHDNRCT